LSIIQESPTPSITTSSSSLSTLSTQFISTSLSLLQLLSSLLCTLTHLPQYDLLLSNSYYLYSRVSYKYYSFAFLFSSFFIHLYYNLSISSLYSIILFKSTAICMVSYFLVSNSDSSISFWELRELHYYAIPFMP